MNASTLRSSRPLAPPATLPIVMEQRASKTTQILTLALLGPACIALALPLLMVAAHISSEPGAFAHLFERLTTPISLVAAVVSWAALFAWPVFRAVERLLSKRTVDIRPDQVTVCDSYALGKDTWTLPIESYSGLVKLVRTSVSGVRQELVLAHDRLDRCVVLAADNRIEQSEIDRLAALLNLREMSSREFYGLEADRTPSSTAAPLSQAHA